MNIFWRKTGKKAFIEELPKKLYVNKPAGKRYIIPDTHGCLDTLRALLTQINLTAMDQLFFLGDYIDRGPNSVELVNYLIDLQKGNNVFFLRGNHEEELLLMSELNILHLIIRSIEDEKLGDFFTDKYKLKANIFDFFNKMPYFIETEDFILVHAGFDFEQDNPFNDTISMLEIRNWNYNSDKAKNKTIVHGHNVTDFEKIHNSILNKSKIIPLDNGCVYKDFESLGNLLCFCLDTFELFIQENIEIN